MGESVRALDLEGLLLLLRYRVRILTRRGKPRTLQGVGSGPPSIPTLPPTLSQRMT